MEQLWQKAIRDIFLCIKFEASVFEHGGKDAHSISAGAGEAAVINCSDSAGWRTAFEDGFGAAGLQGYLQSLFRTNQKLPGNILAVFADYLPVKLFAGWARCWQAGELFRTDRDAKSQAAEFHNFGMRFGTAVITAKMPGKTGADHKKLFWHIIKSLTQISYLNHAAQLPSVETMQGPTGFCGVHFLPKRGHLGGARRPLRISPHLQPAIGATFGNCRPSAFWASKQEYLERRASPLCGKTPRPRQGASQVSKTSASKAWARGLPISFTARG